LIIYSTNVIFNPPSRRILIGFMQVMDNGQAKTWVPFVIKNSHLPTLHLLDVRTHFPKARTIYKSNELSVTTSAIGF
jgi:hypothetical protein